MALQIKKSTDYNPKELSVNVLIYGHPGVGKTTFAAKSGGKTLIADCESGSRFLGLHGIECDVAEIKDWTDMQEVYKLADQYDTVVIDPMGELVDKLSQHLKANGYAKAKGDGLTIEGWGVLKDKFKTMLRSFRDAKCNVVCIAHVEEKDDEGTMNIRPRIQGNQTEVICGLLDAVGYMHMAKVDKTQVRRVSFDPTDRFYAKGRIYGLPDHIDNGTFGDVVKTLRDSFMLKTELKREEAEEEFFKDLT